MYGGAVLIPEWHSLRKMWAGDFALHRLFPVLRESDIPFAQDCFGNQFLLRDGVVHRLRAEIGELVEVGMQLESFMSDVDKTPEDFLIFRIFPGVSPQRWSASTRPACSRLSSILHAGI